MNPPRDAWLQEQIDRYRADNAARAAFFQHAASFLSAEQPRAADTARHRPRLRLMNRWFRHVFGARLWHRRRASAKQPAVLEGVIIPTPTETDLSAQTVIVIDIVQQKEGE